MALIHCPGCGREVTDQANYCLHCGYALVEHRDHPSITVTTTQAEQVYSVMIDKYSSLSYQKIIRILCNYCGYNRYEAQKILSELPVEIVRKVSYTTAMSLALCLHEAKAEVRVSCGNHLVDYPASITIEDINTNCYEQLKQNITLTNRHPRYRNIARPIVRPDASRMNLHTGYKAYRKGTLDRNHSANKQDTSHDAFSFQNDNNGTQQKR